MNPEIERAIENGRLVLLLGAGASSTCKNRKGDALLSGAELAKAMATEAGLPFANEPLPIVYSAAKRKMGDRLWIFLEGLFKHCTPSSAYETIAKFPWARTYTLNIDDAFERALAKLSPQDLNIRRRFDRIVDRHALFDELDCIKLNGSIDRQSDGLIFSPQEYGAASANAPVWYEELAHDFFRYTFLFIGTRLNEPLFYHQIERYRAASNAHEGSSFVLTRDATAIEKDSLRDLHLEHVAGTIEDFSAWLEGTFKSPPTPWDLAVRVYPQLGEMTKRSDPRSYVSLFEKLLPVGRAQLAATQAKEIALGSVRDFYRGFKPSWRDILDEVPAELEVTHRFLQRVVSAREAEKFFVIHGPAGSGKTTALMQTALRISDLTQLPVYYLTEPIENVESVIDALETSCTTRYFFCVDHLSMVGDRIRSTFESGRVQKGVILAAERQNIWNSRIKGELGTWCADQVNLSQINNADAEAILAKVERFGPWTRLGKLSAKARVEELLEKSKRQLLIGLLETTSGIGFEKIIEADYRDLADVSQRQFLVVVGLGTIHRTSIPEALVSRALQNLRVVESVSSLLKKMSGIVHREGNALTARHPVYVERLFEITVGKAEKIEAIKALLGAFAVYTAPVIKSVSRSAGMIFKFTINHGFLRNTLQGDFSAIFDIYRTFERAFQRDGLFWLQFGLALRDGGLHADALEKLRTAVEAYPMAQTEHAYAQQLMIIAGSIDNKTQAYSYLEEAKGILLRLDQTPDDSITAYPIVTLSEHHTEIIRRFEGENAGRELAKNYANLLHQRLRGMPDNVRMKKAWEKLTSYSVTGRWEILLTTE